MSTQAEIEARATASFLGLALGDALGATTEFMSVGEIKGKYKIHNKIIGGGWLGLKAGQVTDDTEMSLCIARAVVDSQGWNLPLIADNFVSWMRAKPIDIGATVRKGLRQYMTHGTLEMPVNEWDAGNGAAMRMAPVALCSYGNNHLLERYSLEQGHLTHNHVLSDAACICIGRMIHAALDGADRFQLHAITRELTSEFPTFRFNKYKGLASGYVVDTLQTVFHHLFSTATFEECLIGVVNQGGDADTTGAIAGMIAGAFYGPEQLPKTWLKKLNKKVRDEIETLSPQLLDISPWGQKNKGVSAKPESSDHKSPKE
jgi:ADP-ribosyl-[dinitrogen reductase] hydrolase